LIRQLQKSGDNQYTLYFDLKPFRSGKYVLRLDYEDGKKYIRFCSELILTFKEFIINVTFFQKNVLY